MSECLKLHISQVFKDDVAKNGFNHVSVAKIMKQSGIRRQTFYENFKDKFDLLDLYDQVDDEKRYREQYRLPGLGRYHLFGLLRDRTE
ncbi:hypothetical protein ME784_14780 [Lactobacillus delbrueckii]|uniref:TetR family transcriptional regulator n=1 Tax=Lactobacillus delbrueckii TaxID=1584 RepID=UPI002081A71C|nr:TetR family transcriptional regulator [Lactobacillus delbrueckii]GHN20963.1 hypothetical protein ME784_14780 [Lactobacillus delbrueckii]